MTKRYGSGRTWIYGKGYRGGACAVEQTHVVVAEKLARSRMIAVL